MCILDMQKLGVFQDFCINYVTILNLIKLPLYIKNKYFTYWLLHVYRYEDGDRDISQFNLKGLILFNKDSHVPSLSIISIID